MRADIAVGATFPDYELPDQTGKRTPEGELIGLASADDVRRRHGGLAQAEPKSTG